MGYKLTLANVLQKAQPYIRGGSLLGMSLEHRLTSPSIARYRQIPYASGYAYSVIGAAFKDQFHTWLIEKGKAGLSLGSLIQQGHVDCPDREVAALNTIDRLDFNRLRHVREHGIDLWGQKLTEGVVGLVGLSGAQNGELTLALGVHQAACERLKVKPHTETAIIGKADRANITEG